MMKMNVLSYLSLPRLKEQKKRTKIAELRAEFMATAGSKKAKKFDPEI
jgi:hypothetical protein